MAVLGVVSAGAAAGTAVGSQRDLSPIEQAAVKSAAAGSVKFDFTLSLSGAGAIIPRGKLSLSGTGAADWNQQTAELKVNLGPLAPLLALALKGGPVPNTVELLAANNTAYIHLPALATRLGAPDKKWVKFDLSKFHQQSNESGHDETAGEMTPGQALTALQPALTVTTVGADRYGTHYHASLNLPAAIALLPTAKRAAAHAKLAEVGITTVPADVWIDGNGTINRLATTVTTRASATHPALAIGFALNLHDYSSPVTVTTPPTSITADGSHLLSNLRPGTSRH
jgi:hypothetical protein